MTIIINLPDQLEGKLRERLEKDDTPLEVFVSEAIAEKLAREPARRPDKPSAYELWQKHFKGYASGESDRSERAEEILRAERDAKHRDR